MKLVQTFARGKQLVLDLFSETPTFYALPKVVRQNRMDYQEFSSILFLIDDDIESITDAV